MTEKKIKIKYAIAAMAALHRPHLHGNISPSSVLLFHSTLVNQTCESLRGTQQPLCHETVPPDSLGAVMRFSDEMPQTYSFVTIHREDEMNGSSWIQMHKKVLHSSVSKRA